MKRLSLIFLLCAAALLAACNEGTLSVTEGPPQASVPMATKIDLQPTEPIDPQPTEPIDPQPTDPIDPQPTEPADPQPIDPSVEDPMPGESPTPSYESYEEYLEFVSTAELPAEFVFYRDIAPLGEFHHFVCLSGGYLGDYSHYMYTLVDESGTELILYVEYNRNGPEIAPLPLIEDIDPENMRQTLSSQRGRYIYEGIEYTYISTGLLNITWEDQGRIFTLSGGNLGSYPNDADTLVGKMMELSRVQEAISALLLS